MLILFRGWNRTSGPHVVYVLGLVSICSGCLRSRAARCELRHLPSCTLPIRVRTVIHPGFLMTLPRGAVAHDNCATPLAAADHSVVAALILVLLLILIVKVLITWLRGSSPMLLIVLGIVHGLLGDRIICPVVFPGRNWWVGTSRYLLPLEVLGILSRERVSMHTTIITIHFSFAWRTCIRHRDIVCTWTGVADRTVLGGVFRASIGIGRAATCAACEIRRNVSSRLLSPVAMILRVMHRLGRSNLLVLSLSASFFKSFF